MTDTTTDSLSAYLDAIREREQAATPGPWYAEPETGAGRVWVQIGRKHFAGADMEPLFAFRTLGQSGGLDNPEAVKAYQQREADALFVAMAREQLPRLLAAVEAVLEKHQPYQLYEMTTDYRNKPLCGHHPVEDWEQHFEGDDGIEYCRDKPTVTVCRSCTDSPSGDMFAEWPCPTVRAISKELTGTGGSAE